MFPTILMTLIVFAFGAVIGSFLNVLIYRIPKHEDFVKTGSHCMTCGYRLQWYDLVPIVSFLALHGRCRKCHTKLSVQYPLIEGLNGLLYCMIWVRCGWSVDSLLYCFLFSALLALSVIDARTCEIPFGFNLFIMALGLIRVATDAMHWRDYAFGCLAVSAVLAALYYLSRGRAIGGGDVKLMAACGLLLGWRRIILAFLLGCILGSVIHVARMRIAAARHDESVSHVLAMGPYLSAGVAIAALWGDGMIVWYLGTLGI